jgi:hypothetical protein
VILGYLEDGPNLVTLAMNGWGEGETLATHPYSRRFRRADFTEPIS